MTEHYTAPEFIGISCDTPRCDERLTTEPLPFHGKEQERFMIRANAAGWRVYAGRTRRVYCPAHEPRPGHKMWLVPPRV
ncbi:hypothetical protein [Actinophytocola sp.]|uniref:hypothetical protein n=1 Tax=Actinophytocola sp. TaxID=1872138 RepID=UPI002D2F3EC1|nr:hypothetical protein [Actinophytocola sp.]HYQ69040.1 hypothetical protein [Actinophytocola sp.]